MIATSVLAVLFCGNARPVFCDDSWNKSVAAIANKCYGRFENFPCDEFHVCPKSDQIVVWKTKWQSEIQHVSAEYSKAVTNKDFKILETLLTNDVYFLPLRNAPVKGKPNALEVMKKILNSEYAPGWLKLELADILWINENSALSEENYTSRIEKGKSVRLYRSENGHAKIAMIIWKKN